jgi:hypothetical protein
MHKPSQKIVSIAPDHGASPLSKMQKAFNSLIARIDKKRALLQAWEDAIPAIHQKYAADLRPLQQTFDEHRMRMVQQLDLACDQKGLTGAERRLIAQLIVETASDLLSVRDDAQLKAIYQRHSGSDFDAETAARLEDAKAMVEDIFGVELGDDVDLNSPEDVAERISSILEAQQQAEDEARQAQKAHRRQTARRSAAQAKREQAREAERAQLSLSVREVYRKLASALHPDRESDPEERARKTALMQRVNHAYERNNLLQLLELQLELEHIDQHALNNIGEDRLKHYNAILKEQLAELDAEIRHVETGFVESFGLPPFTALTPKSAMRLMKDDIATLRHNIQVIERDLLHMFDSIKTLKAWLKRARYPAEAGPFDEMPY